MKMWLGSPGAVTALSGDVNVFVASPLATTSIPTLGPKRVIGANRVASKGFQGGCARARAAATSVQMMTSDADNNDRVRISIVMLLLGCTSSRHPAIRMSATAQRRRVTSTKHGSHLRYPRQLTSTLRGSRG